MMTVREILFERAGENVGTPPIPCRPWSPGDEQLLKVMDRYCYSWDDNRLVEAPRYCKKEIELPDWLDTEEWCRKSVRWSAVLSNKHTVEKFGPKVRRFLDYPPINRKAIESLCRVKKFRSEFRQSLYNQLVAWMGEEEPEHRSPFSSRQWDILTQYLNRP